MPCSGFPALLTDCRQVLRNAHAAGGLFRACQDENMGVKGTQHVYIQLPAVLQISSTAKSFRASVSPGKHHVWRCGSHPFISVCTMVLFLDLLYGMGDMGTVENPWETQ